MLGEAADASYHSSTDLVVVSATETPQHSFDLVAFARTSSLATIPRLLIATSTPCHQHFFPSIKKLDDHSSFSRRASAEHHSHRSLQRASSSPWIHIPSVPALGTSNSPFSRRRLL